jgi:iron complex outermembrane receptor protein
MLNWNAGQKTAIAVAIGLLSGTTFAQEQEAVPAPAAEPAAPSEALGTIPVDAASPPPEGDAQAPVARSRLVEEIIVTANRREENAQDVPQSVTAFSSEKLEAVGIKTIQDLPAVTPGLTITNQAGYNMAFLRGVGTDAFLPGADLSVPFYVDGIPLLGTQGSTDNLGKIERVEVLKGPQGTLFGTNAIGGAINIVTPNPSQQFSGETQVGFGNYDARAASGYFNIPLTEHIAASLSAYGTEQDNFYTNDAGSVIDVFTYGGRLKVLWDLTDDLSNTVTGSYDKMSNNAGFTFENTMPSPIVAGVPLLPADPEADRHVFYDDFQVGAENHLVLLSDTLEWRLPKVTFKGIGSYQKLTTDSADATFGAAPLALANQASTSKQYTGELQFLSNADTPFSDRLTWVGGLFYVYSKGGLDPFSFIIAPGLVNALPGFDLALVDGLNDLLGTVTELIDYDINNGLILYNRGVIEATSISAYFQGTYALTDAFNVIVGARYQHTKKEMTISQTSLPVGNGREIVLIKDELPVLKANQVSPRVGLQYVFSDDTQAYASWARGFKTPTYNTVNLLGSLLEPINPVKEQRNDAFELGLKTELLDNTLRVNSAVFYTKQKDLLTGIVQVLSGGIVNYDNAPKARIWGAESDMVWTPFPNWNPGLALAFSICYLDTKYTDYPNGRGYDEATGIAFGPGNILPLLPERDFTGNEIVRSPDLTYNAAISQNIAMENGSIELAVDGNYNSGFYFSPQNIEIESVDSHYLLNARASYRYDPWALQATLWVKNFTDETYKQIVFIDDFGRNIVLNDPRTYGVRLKWEF